MVIGYFLASNLTFFWIPCDNSAFSFKWWLWLAMTGVSIGIVSSMKWVGFFATSLIGLVRK